MTAEPLRLTTRASGPPRVSARALDVAAALAVPPRDGRPLGRLTPSQRQLAATLAAGDRQIAVSIGRRCGKTTTSLAYGFALAMTGRHRIAYAAQNGLKSVQRYEDVREAVQRAARLVGLSDAFVWRDQAGSVRVTVKATGGRIEFLPPLVSKFRGEAYDLTILDEAQDHAARDARELLAAVLPTMDTRPGAQLIVAGTPAVEGDGCLLWEAIERGRAGRWALAEFGAADGEDVTDPAVWARRHPGCADGLTTAAVLADQLAELGTEGFSAEYLGRWRAPADTAVLDELSWARCGVEFEPRRPAPWLAWDVDASGHAAIVAAWLDGDTAVLELLEHGEGQAWLPAALLARADELGAVGAAYDAGARGSLWAADQLADAIRAERRRGFKLRGLDLADMLSGTADFAARVESRSIRHYRQPGLTAAITGAGRRDIGDSGWLLGRRASAIDITPAVAAVIATRKAVTEKPRGQLVIRSA